MLALLLYVVLLGAVGALGLYATNFMLRMGARAFRPRHSRSHAVRHERKDTVLYRARDLGYRLCEPDTDYTAYDRPTYLRVQAQA